MPIQGRVGDRPLGLCRQSGVLWVRSLASHQPNVFGRAASLSERTPALLAEILSEFPRFVIRPKAASVLCHAIDGVLRVLTLNRQRRFLTEYHTVLGDCLYVAASYEDLSDSDRYILLLHERVHLRQRQRYTSLGFALLYLVPLLPLGLALGRAILEWEAYRETLRAQAEIYGLAFIQRPQHRAWLLNRFVGPDYGWMWPFPSMVRRWYDDAVERIAALAEGRQGA